MVTKLDQYRTDLPTDIMKKLEELLDIPKYLLEQFQERAKGDNSAAQLTNIG